MQSCLGDKAQTTDPPSRIHTLIDFAIFVRVHSLWWAAQASDACHRPGRDCSQVGTAAFGASAALQPFVQGQHGPSKLGGSVGQMVTAACLPTQRAVDYKRWQKQSQGTPFHVAQTKSGRQKGGCAMGEAWVLHDGQVGEAVRFTPMGADREHLVPLGPLFQNKFYSLGAPIRDPKPYPIRFA